MCICWNNGEISKHETKSFPGQKTQSENNTRMYYIVWVKLYQVRLITLNFTEIRLEYKKIQIYPGMHSTSRSETI